MGITRLNKSKKNVRLTDLATLSKVSGSEFRVVTPKAIDNDVLLSGEFRQVRLRSGLILHSTDARELHDLRTETVQRPGLTISLFFEGGVKAWFGGRPFEMGDLSHGTGPYPLEAVAIARARPDQFVRQSVRGTKVRKVNVTVTPEWLEDAGLEAIPEHASILRFTRTHLASFRWKPSPRLAMLAEQLLRPPPYAPLLQNLYCECRAVDMIGEALLAIANTQPAADMPVLHPSHYARIRTACEFIDAHLDRDLSLNEIARNSGMNSSTLQRTFRAIQGTTVLEYVRGRKLEHAREALERDGVTVSEAAYLAGYASSANFATAFRRRYGVSPKHVRARN